MEEQNAGFSWRQMVPQQQQILLMYHMAHCLGLFLPEEYVQEFQKGWALLQVFCVAGILASLGWEDMFLSAALPLVPLWCLSWVHSGVVVDWQLTGVVGKSCRGCTLS
jgi:hypothetical protein